jgi:hypothetical protein
MTHVFSTPAALRQCLVVSKGGLRSLCTHKHRMWCLASPLPHGPSYSRLYPTWIPTRCRVGDAQGLFFSTSQLIAAAVMITYVLTGGNLTPEIIFTTVSLFGLLQVGKVWPIPGVLM